MAEEKPGCDIDDLLCQIRVQSHLQGIHSLLGDEKFQQQFPEFRGLEDTISERIRSQEVNIRESFERCGMQVPEEYEGKGEPAQDLGEV